jgi:16S rRNA C967 or C1407 C5-methylase (RsmB/RsmF family)/NOL1/NOP2/fmu family ribosome biogenesis protein
MEFKEHLKRYLNEKQIEDLLNAMDGESIHCLLLNTKKMSDDKFLSLFPNVKPHPFVKHAYYYDKDEYEFGKDPLYDMGVYSIQDASSMMIAYFLDAKEGDRVLDLCAAPGGKTIGAALSMRDKGLIISNDLSYARAKDLSQNIERMGLGNVLVCSNDFSKIYRDYEGYFNKIILDAPCSGSAMFRKNDLAKLDWEYEKVVTLSNVQKHLIELAYFMLAPGGTLSYSTCSFSYEENEEVILALKANHPEAIFVKLEDDPSFYHDPSLPEGIHFFPNLFKGEGQYLCLIKKPGEATLTRNIGKGVKQYDSFFASFGLTNRDNEIFHDAGYSLTEKVETKKLNLLRYGIHCFDIKEKRIEPAHHLSHFVTKDKTIALSKEEAEKYIRGEAFPLKGEDGFQIVSYLDIPLGFVKIVHGLAKNHYPKGLRRQKFTLAE